MDVIKHGRALAFDAEANALLEKVTKMWCIVAQDIDTEQLFVYHDFPQFNNARVYDAFEDKHYTIPKRDGTLEEGVAFMMGSSQIICHNYWGYDYFLIKKFYPEYDHGFDIVRDTLIQSKSQWFDRGTPKGCKGAHGLQAWGARQGILKPEVSDWSVMDAFKLHRCIQDVKIQVDTYHRLEKERLHLEKITGKSTLKSLAYDHVYRKKVTEQELRGAPVDVPFMEECVEELDTLCEELRIKIEPKLPPTINVKSTKETAHEVATLLGARKPPPIEFEFRKFKGEYKQYEIKKYYRPTINYLKKQVSKLYTVTNTNEDVDFEGGKVFSKLKEARAWVKENYPDVTKGWKYPSTVEEGYVYNNHTCSHFEVEPEDYNLREDFKIVGPHTKLEMSRSKMSQHEVVKKYLVSLGWQPTEWNMKKDSKGQIERATTRVNYRWPVDAPREKQVKVSIPAGQPLLTTPKLTEDSYESIKGEGVGLDIAHFNTYAHRRNFIQNPTNTEKGLLNRVRPDKRVSCGVNVFGTATGRS